MKAIGAVESGPHACGRSENPITSRFRVTEIPGALQIPLSLRARLQYHSPILLMRRR
jgi:hypothetical protein